MKMPHRIAFIGFRHGHILSLYDAAREREDLEIVAVCEEDAATRADLTDKGRVEFTHENANDLLSATECDIVAVGDTFARRGSMLVAGLEAGHHVIADKPACTRLSEIDQISALAADRGLQVSCMLGMRDGPFMRTTRRLLQEGAIGEVHAIQFGGQHPLLLGSRPEWYFEPGEHGGTINDIGIHVIDSIPWACGHQIARVEAARCWNAFAPQYPHFEDGAQVMLTLDNGAGVLGDLSYFAPDGPGYRMPHYWRMTWWGRDGVLEAGTNLPTVHLLRAEDTEGEQIPLDDAGPGYLDAFLRSIDQDEALEGELTIDQVLASSRTTIRIQAAADEGATAVALT